MWVTSSLETILTPTAVALGNFDGVHRGHKSVIQFVVNVFYPPSEHTYSTVVTFNPHPQEFFSGESRQLLTPITEKVAHLQVLGVEQLVLLPFDRELASLSPTQFVENILVQRLKSRCVSVGSDFCFGLKRAGTAKDLQAIAATYGIKVNIVPLQTCETDRISSSLIREYLQQGKILSANRLLGYSYTLSGVVITGKQLGRKLGFPTANLQLSVDKLLPRQGVYCVRVSGMGNDYPFPISGVMNIGYRPTIDGSYTTVEVHLLDWHGDLYGKTLDVSLEKFLRPEQKFATLDDLKLQIQSDCETARKWLMANA